MKRLICLAAAFLGLCACGPEEDHSAMQVDSTVEALTSGLDAVRLTRVCGDGSCGDGRSAEAGLARNALSGSPGYSAYIGFSSSDGAGAVAVDPAGNAYVLGGTNAFGAGGSTFVAKMSPTGQLLNFSYFSDSSGRSIAVDSQGNAYVLGLTYVAKLNASGTAFLYWANFSSDLKLRDIAIDASGNAYITGGFSSAPLNASAFDVYVGKLNATGTALVYSVTFGGSSTDLGLGIAVDGNGNAYVTGLTGSINFPVWNAFQGTSPGTTSAFASKLNAAGTGLYYSTYLGGPSGPSSWRGTTGFGVDIDDAGNAYLTGVTDSPQFPVTSGAIQSFFGGGDADGYLTKLGPTGALVYSTYFGGNGEDDAYQVVVHRPTGTAYVAGDTASTNLLIQYGSQTGLSGTSDAFVFQVNFAGALAYSTYLGGSGSDGLSHAGCIALDSSQNLYVAGGTNSTDFPRAINAYAGGPGDAYVTKFVGP